MAEALGYAAFKARGSRGITDIVCFEAHKALTDYLHLQPLTIQVGTAGKAIAKTLEALLASPRPIGSLCVVARRLKAKNGRVKWQFITASGKFSTLEEAIA